ncbi:MAG: PilT/PilU family type 4a pilus ATPase [Planctomycetota bacterium]|jgi:twitching motility protein PilT
MSEQATNQVTRADRIGKIVHVLIHGDRGKLAGIVVNLSRTGALLTVRGEQWEVGDADPDLTLVGLRVAAHFGSGLKIEFLEEGRTVDAEVVRFTQADVDGRRMICLGCRFRKALDSDMVAPIVHEQPPEPDSEQDPEPAGEPERKPVLTLDTEYEDPVTERQVGLPLSPHGVSFGMHDLLRMMNDRDASDLHLRGNAPIRIRVSGELIPISQRAMTPDEVQRYMYEILTPEEHVRLKREWDLDVAYFADEIGRFRINAFKARGEVGLAIRRIPLHVPGIEELGLAPICSTIAEHHNGLVLVTGPTGSGKSTTLAAMIRHINETRACHIVTMEDPIEFVHREDKAQITQREVGRDVKDFGVALRRAMRQDPDVLLVGEMRDPESIALAVTAAETGHLVFGTLPTTSAPATVERIVEVFPHEQQSQIRLQLASSLRAICSQILVPKADGGQSVAQEILIATREVSALIREGKAQQLENTIQAGAQEGMQTLEDSLNRLIESGEINYRAAMARANNPALIQ